MSNRTTTRGVVAGIGAGLKVCSENDPPADNVALGQYRGSKRRAEETAPVASTAKRTALTSISNKAPTAAITTRNTLKEKNANNCSAVNGQNDAPRKDLLLKETHHATPVAVAAPESAESCAKSPLKLAKKAMRKRLTNVMVDLSSVTPLDYYVKKSDLPEGVPDMDLKVLEDPNCQAHYAHDAFMYLLEREKRFVVSPYIHQQQEMSASYRALLVDWMVEVQEIFELNHETLYMGVKIVDRYLSRQPIRKSQIQLLGGCAMLIASKMDERVPPALDEFVYICDNSYEKNQFIEMERMVLAALDFEISMPLSYSFLRRFCRSIDMDMREMTLARFILECSLMEYSLVGVRESHLAAASLLLALDVLKMEWNDTLTYYTGYEKSALLPTRNVLNKLVHHLQSSCREDRAGTKIILDKYSHEVFHQVALMEFPPVE